MQYFSLEDGVFNTHLPLKYTQNICSILPYNKDLSYIPYTGCLLEHILHTNSLTNNEKLFYLLADSLSLINGNLETKQRSVALSSSTWVKKLNCSKTEIFSLQKSLEEKGYFIIIRDTNKCGKNKRNVIIPTLPDSVFYFLDKEPNRFNSSLEDHPNLSMLTPLSKTNNAYSLYEYAKKRTYLDKSKLFIKLNYQILNIVAASSKISSFAKIVWLDFYSKCYKNHIKSKSQTYDKHLNDYFAFTCSYLELQISFSCSKAWVSKTINSLEGLGFIKRSRFHVKNDNIDDNLCDKSLWNITVTIPEEYSTTYSEDIVDVKPDTYAVEKGGISVYDPYIYDSDQLYNKNVLINNNDLDSLDEKQKTYDDSVSSSSDLSVSFKNNEINKNYNKSKNHSLLNNSIIPNTKPSIPSKSGRSLNSFYPLNKEQVDKLNSSSKREFSTNFANQLLLKLYSRDTSKVFSSSNHMMAYMTKAFLYEKHQAPLVNHESFRFTANLSEDNKQENDIEKYLTEVEYNDDTSDSSRLRRRIAMAFIPKLAYQLLTGTKFDYNKVTEEFENNVFIISLPDSLKLADLQVEKETLENLIVSVYGKVTISYKTRKVGNDSVGRDIRNKILSSNHDVVEIHQLDHNSAWYKVRKKLREHFGGNIDRAWFSKLKAEEDINTQALMLVASSNFYRDWINNHYGHIVRQCCNDLGYGSVQISCSS